MQKDTQTNNELLIRIDERVEQLCTTTNKMLEAQGQLKEKTQANTSKAQELENRIRWNRRFFIGGILLAILAGAVFTYLPGIGG